MKTFHQFMTEVLDTSARRNGQTQHNDPWAMQAQQAAKSLEWIKPAWSSLSTEKNAEQVAKAIDIVLAAINEKIAEWRTNLPPR